MRKQKQKTQVWGGKKKVLGTKGLRKNMSPYRGSRPAGVGEGICSSGVLDTDQIPGLDRKQSTHLKRGEGALVKALHEQLQVTEASWFS